MVKINESIVRKHSCHIQGYYVKYKWGNRAIGWKYMRVPNSRGSSSNGFWRSWWLIKDSWKVRDSEQSTYFANENIDWRLLWRSITSTERGHWKFHRRETWRAGPKKRCSRRFTILLALHHIAGRRQDFTRIVDSTAQTEIQRSSTLRLLVYEWSAGKQLKNFLIGERRRQPLCLGATSCYPR